MRAGLQKIGWYLRVASALVVALFLTSCGSRFQSSLDPAGPQAHRIGQVWWLMFYVSAVIFVIVIASLTVAITRQHKASTNDLPGAVIEPSAEGERSRQRVVVSAVAVTTVILIVFLVESFSAGRSLTAEIANKNGVTIEITGHQWWWEVRYLDPSASNIFTTANEIHIPAGVPIVFSLKANDVIHSFWIPNLSGKKDLIPGKISTIWLQADQPGTYRGQCAEYCGLQHAHMALWVIAESQDQFNQWRQTQTQSAVQPVSESQKRGQEVFLSSTCVMCHAINGTPAASNIGPNLTHIATRKTIAAATLQNTRDNLSQWIINSQHFKPGNKMPQNNLTAADLNSLLDYLQSLN